MSCFASDALQGRVALITGGGTGIGKGIARLLGEHGARVFIASRKEDVLALASAELTADGIDCDYSRCDIRDYADVETMVQRVLSTFGKLDIVVNNAAGNFGATLDQLSANAFKTVVDIDLQGTFNVTKAAFALALKEHGGSVVNISAPFEGWGVAYQAHAAAAKSGVNSLTRSCAVEWQPLGIRVNAVAPGEVQDTEGAERLTEQLTGGQGGSASCTATDIANAVLFLASDAARCISGEVIRVDRASGVDFLKMPVH